MNTTSSNTPKTDRCNIIGTHNRLLTYTACLLIVAGYILMSGPGSDESAFCPDIFSAHRIVIAPMLCLAGYLLMIVAILSTTSK